MSTKKSKLSGKPTRISSPYDTTIHKTERTCVAKVAEWINRIADKKDLDIGLADAETRSADDKYPDLLIFKNPRSQDVLCVAEFKRPYFDPFDEQELKEPARVKATHRRAPYFVTSNFQRLIWFNTERVNSCRPDEEQIHHQYILSEIEDLDLIEEPRYKNSIIAGLERFIVDLYEVHIGKKEEPRSAIDELLIFRLRDKVNRLSKYYRRIIEDQAHKDQKFSIRLQSWFAKQNWSFAWQEADFAKAARQAAYLLVNKILFYSVLQAKRSHTLAPLVIPQGLLKGAQLQKILQSFFDEVLKIDYQTIYSTDFIDVIAFPDEKEVIREIEELVDILRRYDLSTFGYDVIGRIFERLIPPQERHNLGQYFTNPDIVDLILRFCLKHEDDKVFDPACGTGTFLVRAYQHKKLMNQRLTHQKILKTLWGTDIAKFPAHLATINLAINDLSVDKNYPQILQEDFFTLRLGGREEFAEAARKKELAGLGEMKVSIPYPKIVDCIVGNPPYTRQEEIPTITEEKGYKEKLIQNALYDGKKKIASISKRAGVHAYFFVHGTKFLQNGGQFGFIVSESWLDVGYGKGLQEFFLKYYKIITIISSKVERWFEDADINTSIVILEKCTSKREREENPVRFVYLKKPLRHFIPPAQDMWEKQLGRLNEIDKLVKTILAHNELYENEELRIFPKKQAELWKEGFDQEKDRYVGAKWGKYLRAPEIFFKILEKGKGKLVPLKEIAKVRRGFTTGANEFFYLTEEEIKRRGIEKEFWMHQDEKGNWIPNYVIKSPRECKSILVKPEDLKYRVLMIHKDRKDLKGTNVLKYIREGERKGYHNRPTCAARHRGYENWSGLDKDKRRPEPSHYGWYDLDQIKEQLFWVKDARERLPVFSTNDELFCDCRLYAISARESQNQVLSGVLNSSPSILLAELIGRQLGGGGGPRDVMTYEVTQLLTLDPAKLSVAQAQKLRKAFEKLVQRQIDPIFEELGTALAEETSLSKVKPDRRELDKIVMGEILGLTDEEQLEVYKAVVDLVKSRIEKAKSFGKRRKTKGGIDIDLLVKTVMDKIGDETLGKFYRERILSQKPLYTKALPKATGATRIEQDLLGWRLYAGRKHIDCSSQLEARYLKVWLEVGLEKVQVPKDEGYLREILPDLEALKDEIDGVIENYLGAIRDTKLREQILHQLRQEIVK